eukprot:scpid53481/ scgid1322/ 
MKSSSPLEQTSPCLGFAPTTNLEEWTDHEKAESCLSPRADPIVDVSEKGESPKVSFAEPDDVGSASLDDDKRSYQDSSESPTPPEEASTTQAEATAKADGSKSQSFKRRKSVQQLITGFDMLRSCLGVYPPDRHVSKIETLRMAMAYIRDLEKLLRESEQAESTARPASLYPSCFAHQGLGAFPGNPPCPHYLYSTQNMPLPLPEPVEVALERHAVTAGTSRILQQPSASATTALSDAGRDPAFLFPFRRNMVPESFLNPPLPQHYQSLQALCGVANSRRQLPYCGMISSTSAPSNLCGIATGQSSVVDVGTSALPNINIELLDDLLDLDMSTFSSTGTLPSSRPGPTCIKSPSPLVSPSSSVSLPTTAMTMSSQSSPRLPWQQHQQQQPQHGIAALIAPQESVSAGATASAMAERAHDGDLGDENMETLCNIMEQAKETNVLETFENLISKSPKSTI